MVTTKEELLSKLNLEGLTKREDIEKEFPKIAYSLINHFAILKGNEEYRIVELEFYHNKTDIGGLVTIKRTAKPGQWFFHSYGVDLTFASNADLYGGILIRAINKDGIFFNGPGRVADELFDVFDALSTPDNFPMLIMRDWKNKISPNAFDRWPIKTISQKYRYVWPQELWPQEKKYKAYPYDSIKKQ